MKIGLNIGYSRTKYAANNGKAGSFPSVSGTPDASRFGVGDAAEELRLVTPGGQVLVGDSAVTHSRFVTRHEGREWPRSDTWMACAWAAFSEITTGTVSATVVTGLPVSFYNDKDAVTARLSGEHRVARVGRSATTVRVAAAYCIPEPFGALMDVALNAKGGMRDQQIATGNVAVIDVGGHTTNLLAVRRMREISRETLSLETGGWDVVRKVRDWIDVTYPGLRLRDHEVVDVILAKQLRYYGEAVDISEIVAEATADLARSVMSGVSQIWNVAALDAILVTGGGGALVYDRIKTRQTRLVDEPIMANARGFLKYAYLRAEAVS